MAVERLGTVSEIGSPPHKWGFTMPKDGTPILSTPMDYWTTWIDIFREAKEFAGIWSMNFNKGHAVSVLLQALRTAGHNGAVPFVYYDGISSLVTNENRLFRKPWGDNSEVDNLNFARASMFNSSGILQIHEVNSPNWYKNCFPSQNTDHRKGTVTERFAGMPMFNWTDASLSTVDAGLTFSDAKTVEAYQKMFFDAFYGTEQKDDYVVPLNPDRQMLVDTGRRFHSGIQRTIDDMIDRAQTNFYFVSQFTPDPLTGLRILDAVVRDVDFHTYNSAEDDRKLRKGITAEVYKFFRGVVDPAPNHKMRHHPTHYIHPKIFMRDLEWDDDGNVVKGEGLIGTHNGVRYTEWFATKEVAFHTTEPALLSQMWWLIEDFDNQPRPIKNYALERRRSELLVPSGSQNGIATY